MDHEGIMEDCLTTARGLSNSVEITESTRMMDKITCDEITLSEFEPS